MRLVAVEVVKGMFEEETPPPEPPDGLKDGGLKLWRDVNAVFNLCDDPHRQAQLGEACFLKDLIDRMQRVLDESETLRVRGSQGQSVACPELTSIISARSLLNSILTGLKLPDTEEMKETRAKHVSAVRRAAVQVRYGG